MDRDSGTQNESAWEIPESLGEWAGALSVMLLLTAIVAAPIVGGVMYLWLDAPIWSLAIALVLIAGAATWLVFAPEIENPPEEPPADNQHWVRVRPKGGLGWLKYFGSILGTFIGINCIVNVVILDLVFGVSRSTQGKVALGLLTLAIVVQTFDLVENDSASEPAPEHPDERPGLVDA